MKKVFSFVMVMAVLVTAFGFSVGSASARPLDPQKPVPVVSLYPEDFGSFTPGVKVDAQMFVDSNFHDLYCVAKDDGRVACKFPKKFAEMDATIYLTVDKDGETQVLIFYVTLPKLKEILVG